jgi:hypothetical protein
MRIWPFKPRTPHTEALEWLTDVFEAKSGEQRIGLRRRPRRTLTFAHVFDDEMANYARVIIRNAQADGGFKVPDWTQAKRVGPVSSGTGVSIPASLENVYIGDEVLLWDSEYNNEVVEVTWDSNGVTGDVANEYGNPYVMPIWPGDTPDGLSLTRLGKSINSASINFILTEAGDLGSSTYPVYRGHDVITDCPILSNSTFDETTSHVLSVFDNRVGDVKYLRRRDLAVQINQMRWHKFTDDDKFDLRQWLHSRMGRLKAFWLSTRGNDLTPVSLSGTTLTVYNDILARPAEYDLEIVVNGTSYYRQVTNVVAGTDVNGRSTVDLTIDSSISSDLPSRVSMLQCVRFDSDRIELEHGAKAGMQVQVPVKEVPVP